MRLFHVTTCWLDLSIWSTMTFNSWSPCFHSQVLRLQVFTTLVGFYLFLQMYYFKLCVCVWVWAHTCWCLQRPETEMLDSPWNDRYLQLWVSRHGFSVGSFLTCWTISLAHKYLFLFSVYVWVPTCVSMGHMCAWFPPGAEDGIGSLETRVTDVCEPPCGCWEQPGSIQEQWAISLAPGKF